MNLKPDVKAQFKLERELEQKYGCCLKSCELGCRACGSVNHILERIDGVNVDQVLAARPDLRRE